MTQFAEASNSPKIEFVVSFSEPQAHYVDVEMQISNINKKEILVAMPVWAPGSYLVREFAKNVDEFNVKSSTNDELPFEKVTKNSWKITTKGNKSIVINYRVYAFEISVRTSFVNDEYAFLSPTGTFLYVKEFLNHPVKVKIVPHEKWTKVTTGLEPVSGEKFTYQAKNFDWLFDSPIQVGNQDVFEFDAAGVKHEVAMVGGGNYNKAKLSKDMAKVVEECTAVYGENPNKNYAFIVHNYQNGGGGLEHLNSTVLGAKRTGYTDPIRYKQFLSLVAHEYFHLWNVKRLRPVALGPFDYDNENYTTDLWIAEGFTAYYDNLLIQRSEAISIKEYLKLLADEYKTTANLPGDKIQSVAEASFDAWIKYYRQNENSSNSNVSYYNKGAVLASLLDLTIINNTNGEKSLDDVMKQSYEAFYKKRDKGYSSKEFKEALEKVNGAKLDEFYENYVYGTKAINFDAFLNYAGLVLKQSVENKPSLGVVVNAKGIITKVIRGTSGWHAGLNVNDEILAINGERVDATNLLSNKKPGDNLTVMISRDGVLKDIEVTVESDGTKEFSIVAVEKPTEKQEKVFKKWMKL